MEDRPAVPLLQVMEESETVTAEIYAHFADQFPGQAEFWRRLAGEEQLHARWLRELRERAERGQIGLSPQAIDREQADLCLAAAKIRRVELTRRQLSLREALQLALDLEKSILEQNPWRVFEGSGERSCELIELMQSHTARHAEEVGAWLRRQS
jgi:hypothetical protein